MKRAFASVLLLFPMVVLASEECVAQLGGACRPACEAGEKPEQGAFIDCAEKDRCCVPDRAKDAAAASPVIRISDMAFVPAVLKVKAGAEVVWKNEESSIHTVTAADGSFASPPLDLDDSFKRTFTKPGTYAYTCEMHPFMSGKVVVE